MTRTIQALQQAIAEAVAAQAFEQAAALQDELVALQHAQKPMPPSKLQPQIPGKMGLGTSDQTFKPPPGWTPPKRPDMLTKNHKPRRGGR
jgi:hypothetical protein